ncbi:MULTISPECIES: hypothetical protein [unclassified Nocardioides]|uniref:hypothetical protein n=1 Tax=unclassified Nocardioides TaxID=2615069 RepID=UPI00114FF0D7|nr:MULTISPECIES: hypothetical protein [unclassified Nocardioides]TQK71738.1 hypothetical protein FBY23_3537 [Nocardioides sp. SLBN-35]WGY04080.1 hypothetical protein QI633_10000 [Nocardioides sp. QY071]
MAEVAEVAEGEAYDVYAFDVFTSRHDDVQAGRVAQVRSRVLVSRAEFPRFADAYEVAANLATAVHGGMPTAVLPRW